MAVRVLGLPHSITTDHLRQVCAFYTPSHNLKDITLKEETRHDSVGNCERVEENFQSSEEDQKIQNADPMQSTPADVRGKSAEIFLRRGATRLAQALHHSEFDGKPIYTCVLVENSESTEKEPEENELKGEDKYDEDQFRHSPERRVTRSYRTHRRSPSPVPHRDSYRRGDYHSSRDTRARYSHSRSKKRRRSCRSRSRGRHRRTRREESSDERVEYPSRRRENSYIRSHRVHDSRSRRREKSYRRSYRDRKDSLERGNSTARRRHAYEYEGRSRSYKRRRYASRDRECSRHPLDSHEKYRSRSRSHGRKRYRNDSYERRRSLNSEYSRDRKRSPKYEESRHAPLKESIWDVWDAQNR